MNKVVQKKLSEVSNIVMGQSPSSSYVFDDLEHGLPFLQGSAEFNRRFPSPLKSCSNGSKKANKGSVLISVRAPVGDTNFADRDFIIGRGLASIEANRVDADYLSFVITFSKLHLEKVSQGSTFAAIGSGELQNLEIPIFGPNEQKKIAQILTSIDEKIELTIKLIEKKRFIKRGLLSELLSRYSKGNDDTIILNELLYGVRGVSYTPSQLLSEQSSHSFTLLRSNNIKDNRINFDSIQLVPKDLVSDDQKAVPGDIAVCMSNGSRSLVGKSASFSEGIKSLNVTVGAFCSIFKPKDRADASFLSHLFQSSLYQKHIDIVLAGSAINNLQNKVIEGLKIPHINKKARFEIGEILNSADIELDSLISEFEKLKLQQQGLMHDLFTGQVSVG
jgi:type I restriction enzyme S subunit